MAKRLLTAKNQAIEQPCLNVAMARVYLSAQSPEFVTRTWGHLIESVAQGYEGATAVRWRKFAISAPLNLLVEVPLYQTEAAHMLAVLDHKSRCVDERLVTHPSQSGAELGMAPCPSAAQEALAEGPIQGSAGHQSQVNTHRCCSPKRWMTISNSSVFWETGGSQTDIANLRGENVDWANNRLFYSRKKLASRGGGMASLAIGAGLKAVLEELPASGALFPRLRLLTEDERASHFRKVCLRVGIAGVTLHSYRYAWAERAYAAGMPVWVTAAAPCTAPTRVTLT